MSQWFVPWYLGEEVWFQNLARSLCSGIYETLNSVITQLHKVEYKKTTHEKSENILQYRAVGYFVL